MRHPAGSGIPLIRTDAIGAKNLHRERDMHSRGLLIVSTCFAFGLAGCVAPIKREHGYPAEWPDPLEASKGVLEINGSYSNHGTLFSTDTGFEEVTLASLIPDDGTFRKLRDGVPVPNPACTECVVLRIRPGPKWSPMPTLEATVSLADEARRFEVEALTDEKLLKYSLVKPVSAGRYSFGGSQGTRVALTVAADGSLIARIGMGDELLFAEILASPEYFAKYFWARFERVGD